MINQIRINTCKLLVYSLDYSLDIHQYIDYSVFLSHFILLTRYQSYSSNFLVPMNISGVLPLPSPSSSSHYQKRVTAITPTTPKTLGFRQFCWSNCQSQGTYWQIFRSWAKPNKDLPKTTPHAPPRAATCLHTLGTRHSHASHAPHVPTSFHALPRQP